MSWSSDKDNQALRDTGAYNYYASEHNGDFDEAIRHDQQAIPNAIVAYIYDKLTAGKGREAFINTASSNTLDTIMIEYVKPLVSSLGFSAADQEKIIATMKQNVNNLGALNTPDSLIAAVMGEGETN